MTADVKVTLAIYNINGKETEIPNFPRMVVESMRPPHLIRLTIEGVTVEVARDDLTAAIAATGAVR